MSFAAAEGHGRALGQETLSRTGKVVSRRSGIPWEGDLEPFYVPMGSHLERPGPACTWFSKASLKKFNFISLIMTREQTGCGGGWKPTPQSTRCLLCPPTSYRKPSIAPGTRDQALGGRFFWKHKPERAHALDLSLGVSSHCPTSDIWALRRRQTARSSELGSFDGRGSHKAQMSSQEPISS